jgi:hypothetical protein
MNFTAQAAFRTGLTASALVVAAMLAAGCSSSSSSSAPASGSGTSGTSSSTPASSGASGSSGSGSSGAGSSGAGAGSSGTPGSTSTAQAAGGSGSGTGSGLACGTLDLSANVGSTEGAAGTAYSTIDLTNIGGTSCTLYGYPGVSLADSSAAQIGAAATRSSTQLASTVTLASGSKANFVLGVADAGNYSSGTCQPKSSAYLKIFPPNQTQSLEIPFKTTGCAASSVKLLSVTVVSSGATNSAG